MRRHDDLTSWGDEPVVRALIAPGTAAELAGEADALAAFRAAVPVRPRRRYLGRVGVGGSAAAVALVLSGGVAAAYTSSLPAPLQRAAHSALGVIDVPAAHKSSPKVSGNSSHGVPGVTSTPSSPAAGGAGTPSPSATPSQARHPLAGHRRPGHRRPGAHPTPSTSPSTSPTPTSSPTPTPTGSISPVPPVPGSITISLSASTVSVGGSVTVSGRIATAAGKPISGERIWLLEQAAGQHRLSQVASGMSSAAGTVVLETPALDSNATFRLSVRPHTASAVLGVVVDPTLTASISAAGSLDTIQAQSTGGRTGDAVILEVRHGAAWRHVATTRLDGSDTADFQVPAPHGRAAHYRVLLPSTSYHGSAEASVTAPGATGRSR